MGNFWKTRKTISKFALVSNLLAFIFAFNMFLFTNDIRMGLLSIIALSMFKLVWVTEYLDFLVKNLEDKNATI
jgi:hypothetical protein